VSDAKTRELEKEAAAGDERSFEQLKREWLRTQTYTKCPGCGDEVPSEVLEEHSGQDCRKDMTGPRSGPMPVVKIPVPGMIGGRPRKEPLWDRAVLQPGQNQVSFFSDGTLDKPVWESNFPPGSYTFFWYGVSLIPDAAASANELRKIWDQSVLSSWFRGDRVSQWPGRAVIADQPWEEVEREEGRELRRSWDASEIMHEPNRRVRLRDEGAVRAVTISGKPIQLNPESSDEHGTPQVRFRLNLPDSLITEPVGLMVVMYGLLVLSVAG
jgi:hypothetical protein